MKEQEIKTAALKDALKVLPLSVLGSGIALLLLSLRQLLKYGFVLTARLLFVGAVGLVFSVGVSIYVYIENVKLSRNLAQKRMSAGKLPEKLGETPKNGKSTGQ